jgi:hypothetical protein
MSKTSQRLIPLVTMMRKMARRMRTAGITMTAVGLRLMLPARLRMAQTMDLAALLMMKMGAARASKSRSGEGGAPRERGVRQLRLRN